MYTLLSNYLLKICPFEHEHFPSKSEGHLTQDLWSRVGIWSLGHISQVSPAPGFEPESSRTILPWTHWQPRPGSLTIFLIYGLPTAYVTDFTSLGDYLQYITSPINLRAPITSCAEFTNQERPWRRSWEKRPVQDLSQALNIHVSCSLGLGHILTTFFPLHNNKSGLKKVSTIKYHVHLICCIVYLDAVS